MTEALDRIRDWEGLATVLDFDARTGTWLVIALHDRRLGPPTGGSRMKPYPSLAQAVHDAHRLAAGMTAKWAGIDRPYGGAKAVLMIPGPLEPADRRHLLYRYGDLIAGLEDGFRTGPDMGTTPDDMAVIAERTDSVMGLHPDTGAPVDPGPYTAQGVFAGMRATVRAADGRAASEHSAGTRGDAADEHAAGTHSDAADEHAAGTQDDRTHADGTHDDRETLADRTVLVQGVGDVGEPLARLLAAAGAELILSDLDTARAERLARELDARTVPAGDVYDTPCDIYAPCAVGATVNARTVPRLCCRMVAGSANNQLAEDADADRLAERGILYAPDWVINAGGALAFADLKAGDGDLDALLRSTDRAVDQALTAIFAQAAAAGITPLDAARQVVSRRLADARRTDA